MLSFFNFLAVRFGINTAWRALALWLPLLALVAGAAGGAYAAWHLGRAPLRTENAELRTAMANLRSDHAEATRLTALAGARRLQEAQARSDTLAGELLDTLAANHQLTEEKTHALRTATTGRACLSDRALRVLHGAPGITLGAPAHGLPAPRAGAAAAHAAPAAHTDADGGQRVATDTGIAVWIATAGGQYEACRQRLNALIAWHAPTAHQEPHREPQ